MTATVPHTTPGEISETVRRLRDAFDTGRTRPLAWRQEQLRALRTMLVEHEDDFLDALTADLGKPRLEGYVTDVGYVVSEVERISKALPSWVRPRPVRVPLSVAPGRARVVPQPRGVALVIAPWNYPIQLLLAPMAAAIAAGNAVVGKPSEVAPATSAVLAEQVRRHLDPDAVAIVEGGVEETTALLDERFDHLFYTGNGTVGRIVMQAAARHLTPVTLELGGKSPTIVAADARLDVAARRIAFGKYLNAGQTCVAPDYVLVERAVYEPFLDHLVRAVRRAYGDDPRRSRDYGRIINERHFDRIAALLEGQRVVCGGDLDRDELYVAPTVLRDVDPDSPVMQEEIFGPLLPVLRVDDVGSAIAFVRARPHPLALYVFTEDDCVAERILAETTSGGACVNATVLHLAVPGLPFGGVGASGWGAYHGRRGFDTFSHERSVLVKPSRPDPGIAYPPYGPVARTLLRRIL